MVMLTLPANIITLLFLFALLNWNGKVEQVEKYIEVALCDSEL